MYMSEGMDEWDILNVAEVEIWENDKTPDIFKKFEEIWPNLLVKTLKWIISWESTPQKQDEKKATYCSKIKKEDWEIDFKKETAKDIYNKFRAYYPWPGIYTYYNWKKLNLEKISFPQPSPLQEMEPGSVIKIDKKTIWIVCSDKKILILKQVKLEWKKSMDIISFVNWNKEFLDFKF
jgi:methionyl-tRNA formyltransferase